MMRMKLFTLIDSIIITGFEDVVVVGIVAEVSEAAEAVTISRSFVSSNDALFMDRLAAGL